MGDDGRKSESDAGERGQPVHQLVLESRVASLWCRRVPLPVIPVAATHARGCVVADGEPCLGEIARPAIFMLPHQDPAWKIIKERLDALRQACASLGQQAGLGALAPLADKLQSMSQDIGTHGTRTGG